MSTERYMIVEHKRDEADLYAVGGKVYGRISIHTLLRSYHWHRIDDTHVILLGSYSSRHHNTLATHPRVTLMPHLSSSKQLKKHFDQKGKLHHYHALSKVFAMGENAAMGDFLDHVEEHLGPVFQPRR